MALTLATPELEFLTPWVDTLLASPTASQRKRKRRPPATRPLDDSLQSPRRRSTMSGLMAQAAYAAPSSATSPHCVATCGSPTRDSTQPRESQRVRDGKAADETALERWLLAGGWCDSRYARKSRRIPGGELVARYAAAPLTR